MAIFVDDNYGTWDMDEDGSEEFYFHTQKTNVEKECEGCGRLVKIQPQYGYCNSCAERLERGLDLINIWE